MTAPVVVLDTNVIQRDWTCTGLGFQLLRRLAWDNTLSVVTPAPVVEEVVANHGRQVRAAGSAARQLEADRRRLGMPPLVEVQERSRDVDFPRDLADRPAFLAEPEDYRAHLLDTLAESVGFSVAAWPVVSHKSLVARAVGRVAPFDSSGGGYRDALVWHTAVECALGGRPVVLVSADKAFRGPDDRLAAALGAEAARSDADVRLEIDMSRWLVSLVPVAEGSLREAVQMARDAEFETLLLESDIVDELVPSIEALGLFYQRQGNVNALEAIEVTESVWTGDVARTAVRRSGDVSIVTYRLGVNTSYIAVEVVSPPSNVASFQPPDPSGPSHRSLRGAGSGRELIEGVVAMAATVTVMFDDHGSGPWVDEVTLVRADGSPPSPPLTAVDPLQRALFGPVTGREPT